MNWILLCQIISLIGIAPCVLMLIRNNQVHRFRSKLLNEEDSFLRNRIRQGKGFDTFRRHNSLPGYCAMVFKFWKPLKKYEKPLSDFYKD